MLQTDIRQMDYTQLRQRAYQLNEELEELKGEFSRWKREISDMLENLDESNFSSHIRKQRDKMMAQLTITPEQIRSAVCKGIDLGNAEKIETAPGDPTNSGKLDKDKIYLYDGNYYYYNQLSKAWEQVTDNTIYSLCEQTPEGFYLKGNVIIDGKTVKLRNIEFESETPLKQQYSKDGVNWHDEYKSGEDIYMRISTDGGTQWSTPFQISSGDTTVTPDMVFKALTNDEAKKGLFTIFGNSNDTKLYINADYIKAGTLSGDHIKGGTVSGTSFTDANNIATLVLGYTTQSGKDYANLKLVRNDGNLMMFGVEDNSGSGTTSASIFVCGKSIGWGDVNAFNPNGKWNFSSATISNANISATQLEFTGNNAAADFSNAKSVKFNGANVDFTKANVTGLEGYYVFSE